MNIPTVALAILAPVALAIAEGAGAPHMGSIRRDGNRIVDAKGHTFRHRGVAIEDPEVIVQVRGRSLDSIVAEVKERFEGINTIRIPAHPDGAEGCAGVWADVDSYIDLYLIPLVEICRRHEVRALLCYHAVEDWHPDLLDSHVIPFWSKVLERLTPADQHVDLELFNEAIDPADWTAWRTTFAQPLIDWINYETALFPLIGAPRWNQFYPEDIVAEPITGNFAATIHPYPGHGTTYGDWDAAFGHLAAICPVVCTEFGFETQSPMNQQWLIGGQEYFEELTQFLDVHQIGSVAWVYSETWEPRMLHTDGTLRHFGSAVRDYYEMRAEDDDAGDPVLFEGGWVVFKPASVYPGGAVVVWQSEQMAAVSEVSVEYKGSSSAYDRSKYAGTLRVEFVPSDGGQVILRQVVLPYGGVDRSPPTASGVLTLAVPRPTTGHVVVSLGHSHYRTEVHHASVAVAQFAIRTIRPLDEEAATLRWRSTTGARYRLETSPDLSSGFSTLMDDLPATPPINRLNVPHGGSPRVFHRIVQEQDRE